MICWACAVPALNCDSITEIAITENRAIALIGNHLAFKRLDVSETNSFDKKNPLFEVDSLTTIDGPQRSPDGKRCLRPQIPHMPVQKCSMRAIAMFAPGGVGPGINIPVTDATRHSNFQVVVEKRFEIS